MTGRVRSGLELSFDAAVAQGLAPAHPGTAQRD